MILMGCFLDQTTFKFIITDFNLTMNIVKNPVTKSTLSLTSDITSIIAGWYAIRYFKAMLNMT